MSVNGITQYIGARYVPKFFENSGGTSAWTANTEYEPLTIVTRNGNSYTSKKPVPANIGAPEDNPAYWAATGIQSEQIAGIIDRLNQDETKITDLEERNDNRKIYNPMDYGAAGDGSADDTNAVQNCIDDAIENGGLVYIPAGTYIVNGVTVNDYVDIIGIGTLKASNICDSVVTINVPYFYDAGRFTYWKDVATMILRIDGNGTAANGINGLQMNHVYLGNGSMIYGVNNYGVKMSEVCPEVLIDGLYIEGAGGSCIGIYVGEDAEVRNVIMKDCHIALETSKACFISNVHAWVTRATSGSTFLKHNAGICTIMDFYSDTYERTFYKADTAGAILATNFRVHCNPSFLDPATAYIFYDDADGNCFRYSIFKTFFAERLKLSNKDNMFIGMTDWKINNMTIPDGINKLTEYTFEGQTGGNATVHIDPINGRLRVKVGIDGAFTGNIQATGTRLVTEERFFTGTVCRANRYNPIGVCQIYVATNGNFLIKPDEGLTNYGGATASFEIYPSMFTPGYSI